MNIGNEYVRTYAGMVDLNVHEYCVPNQDYIGQYLRIVFSFFHFIYWNLVNEISSIHVISSEMMERVICVSNK